MAASVTSSDLLRTYTGTVVSEGITPGTLRVMRHDLPVEQLDLEHQVLCHVVDLFEQLRGSIGGAVLEGHLVVSMAPTFGLKVPAGEVDDVLRSFDPHVRARVRNSLTDLAHSHLLTIMSDDDPQRGWKISPTGPGYEVARKWRAGRMQYLERIHRQPGPIRSTWIAARTPQTVLTFAGGCISGALGVLVVRLLGA